VVVIAHVILHVVVVTHGVFSLHVRLLLLVVAHNVVALRVVVTGLT